MSAILLAPDKFKDSLDAAAVADALAAGIADIDPGRPVRRCPVADGGEGTVAAALAAGWEPVTTAATGPTGAPLTAVWARDGGSALVELASTAGLAVLPGGERAPGGAGTEGLGSVLAAVLDAGCTDVVVGLGGSATTDGGAGLLRGLGARVLDADGAEVGRGGAALARADRLDLAGLHPRLRDPAVRVRLAADVDNPLLGPDGAAAVYGPQKGADAAGVAALDDALARWVRVLAAATGTDADTLAAARGAGAAGGAGLALTAVCGAHVAPGVGTVLELTGFDDELAGAGLVVTGEGRLDAQTLHGKAPAGVAAAARAAGTPVVAVAGQVTLGPAALRAAGFVATYALTDTALDHRDAVERAAELLRLLGARIATDHPSPTRPMIRSRP